MDLKLEHRSKDGIETVDIEGEIDVYAAPRFRELLLDLIDKGCREVVVNLEKVAFVDSTGLGVLVGALKRMRADDGSLTLVCTRDQVLKVFQITGLAEVFDIYSSVDEAIEARQPAR